MYVWSTAYSTDCLLLSPYGRKFTGSGEPYSTQTFHGKHMSLYISRLAQNYRLQKHKVNIMVWGEPRGTMTDGGQESL